MPFLIINRITTNAVFDPGTDTTQNWASFLDSIRGAPEYQVLQSCAVYGVHVLDETGHPYKVMPQRPYGVPEQYW